LASQFWQTNEIEGLYTHSGREWRRQRMSGLIEETTFDVAAAGSNTTPANFTLAISGTGANGANSAPSFVTETTQGWTLVTGTTTTGRAALSLTAGNSLQRQLIWNYQICVVTLAVSALSDDTDTYVLRFGFLNNAAAESSYGMYFRYTHSVDGGNWQAVCTNANVSTTVNLGFGPTVRGVGAVYQKIMVKRIGVSEVEFWIDGVLLTTITTNVPIYNNLAANAPWSIYMQKETGTTSRAVRFTYCLAEHL
jgi:hypothetical protein